MKENKHLKGKLFVIYFMGDSQINILINIQILGEYLMVNLNRVTLLDIVNFF